MALPAPQQVEFFHLSFLRQLSAGADRTHLTLKGGCNLRFFFHSLRYSEDLDLDVSVIAKGTLKNKVDRVLEAPALTLPLKARGLELVDVSAPKQTDTTQRWKLGLRVDGQSAPLRTKVEFSRREHPGASTSVAIEPVDRAVVDPLGLSPPLVQHYVAAAAIEQKIAALVGRPETQARDLFDLHLLRTHRQALKRLSAATRASLPRAIERAMSLSYDDYRGQVVAYLDPAQARPFEGRAAWDALQLDVVEFL
jgi:predicted nucleotidyltransferase component of viral defense system